jgi:LacI family transcriptional regulator
MTRRQLRVPDDIAIVGYDDIDFAAAAAVPLSSVRQPRHELGRQPPTYSLRRPPSIVATATATACSSLNPDLVVRASSDHMRPSRHRGSHTRELSPTSSGV